MKKLTYTLISLGLVAGLSACNWDKSRPNVELIQDMMSQENIKSQEYDEFFKGGISEQEPPEHTMPVGFIPYRYKTDLAAAERENKNPLAGKMDADTLLTGQKFFETNCMVCHGATGKGDGTLVQTKKYPLAIPALVTDKVKAFSDAHIYHIITMGEGVMGPYASHVPQKYRWQVVNYIRHLQKHE